MKRLRHFLIGLAPPGSRPRNFISRLLQLRLHWQAFWLRQRFAHFRNHPPVEMASLNSLLASLHLPILTSEEEPGSIRWILSVLLTSPELRQRFPQALSEGAEGGFGRELLARNPEVAEIIRESFAGNPGKLVRQFYDEIPGWAAAFELALTPIGSGVLLVFLLRQRQKVSLSIEVILWFHLQNTEDPYCGVAASYLRNPAWQKGRPQALSRTGWLSFRFTAPEEWRDRISETPPGDLQPYSPESDTPSSGFNILGHFCYQCGLQEVALNTTEALRTVGIPFSCRDVPPGRLAIHPQRPDRDRFLGLEYFDVTLFQIAPFPLTKLAYSLARLHPRKGVYRVAVWYWELEHFPRKYRKLASLFREIWAPTTFIREAIEKTMSLPVYSMPPSVRTPQGPNLPRSVFGLHPDHHVFLFAFDMCSSMDRKNPLAIIEAFREAFPASAPVQLVIKISRGESDPENLARLTAACQTANMVLIDRVLTRPEFAALMNLCDTYVSLHRSEGFGLTLAEAMLLGKPVIATGYSGNLDFMNAGNSLLIPYAMTRCEMTHRVYGKEILWANPDIAAAVKAMQWVVSHPEEARQLGEKAREEARLILSPEAYGRRLQKRLEEIRARH